MDAEFITSNNVFARVLKKLHREGRDKSSHHQAITGVDFQKIKHSQALSPNRPWGLVSKVWFNVQLHMGRRANEGNCQLKPDSFSIRHNENSLKYVTLSFNKSTKNHKDAAENHCVRSTSHCCLLTHLPFISTQSGHSVTAPTYGKLRV